MHHRAFPKALGTLSDKKLRDLFQKTLKEPGCLDQPFAAEWKTWLVFFLLEYFSEQILEDFNDRCYYIAFALRHLAAIYNGAEKAIQVRPVMMVMANRPGVVAGLLFGSIEERLRVLKMAFDPSADWNRLPTDSLQREVIEEYMRIFSERTQMDGDSAFDESTVGRWTRTLIPSLEKLVIDQIKPARQIAQNAVRQQMTANPQSTEALESDRAVLIAFVEQCRHDPLNAHYGIALTALNDYNRRAENGEQLFKTQRGWFLMMLVMGVSGGIFFVVAWFLLNWLSVPSWLLQLLIGLIACTVLGFPYALLHLFSTIIVNDVHITEHITRTRTDIQTQQQLSEHRKFVSGQIPADPDTAVT